MKTECPKVAGYIVFGECPADLPRMFGNSVADAIGKLIESAVYGCLLRPYTNDDLKQFRIDIHDMAIGFTQTIYFNDDMVGVISFLHATQTHPPTIKYEPNKK